MTANWRPARRATRWIAGIFKQIIDLFVHDESLASSIVVWLILMGVLTAANPRLRLWGGLVLLAGAVVIMAHSALERRRK